VGHAQSLRSLRPEAFTLGAPEIPQTCATSTPRRALAEEDCLPTPSIVHPLARLWKSPGTDDGSRMTRECHVRFCEGLWVKLPRSTLHVSKTTLNQRF